MRKAFVIGHPVKHSRSPLIHGTWLEALGIPGSYEAIDVSPQGLPDFFARLRGGEFAGGNVTLPHKEAALALCDSVDPLAGEIGAVNTVVVREGTLLGFNTDHHGFLANLDDRAPGWSNEGGPAIVLGAGGASRAVLLALRSRGFAPLHILNRTRGAADRLAAAFGDPFRAGELGDFARLAPAARLLVNTTSVGLGGSSFPDLPLERLGPGALVTDIVYVPLETPLLREARRLGLRTADGLGMLLHQAVPGFAAWFSATPTVTPALRRRIEASVAG